MRVGIKDRLQSLRPEGIHRDQFKIKYETTKVTYEIKFEQKGETQGFEPVVDTRSVRSIY